MAKTVVRQTSFAAGELSPLIFGRAEKEIYFSGGDRVRNIYIRPQGGVTARYGSKYIGNTAGNAVGRQIAFEFNTEQVYNLVFTAGQFVVYRDDALVATVTTGVTGLTDAIIAAMDHTQSNDTLILVHPDIPPIRITRTSHTAWTASNITLSNIPTYDFGSGAETVWSATRGWPRSVTFWQQRLWFGGSRKRPQTLWGSKIAGYFDFDLGTGLDDEAIEATIDNDQSNEISSLFAGRTLQIFTVGGEYFVPLNIDGATTPSTVRLERATRHGTNGAKPVSSDGATIFVDAQGAVVREYLYLDIEQSYVSDDISYLSSHLIKNPTSVAIQRATTQLPASYVYFVNSDGTMAVLQRQRSQKFLAWALWETDGEYEDVAVVGTDVYVIVKRVINSATVRFIEKFDSSYYTDAGIKVTSGSPTDSWTGLGHLEGEEVYVYAVDFPLLNNTVASGAITTEKELENIEVGLPWIPTLRTMPIESDRGVISGKRRRIVSANLQLYECDDIEVNGNSVPLSSLGDITFGEPLPLFTGWKRVYATGYSRAPQLTITRNTAGNFSLNSLVIEVTV